MKIASAYLIASLCVLPSAQAAVRSRSLVRGVTAPLNYRLLQETAETPEEPSGDEPESKGGKKESPIAPKKRDCKLRQEGETNEVSFKCKAKSDDANAKVKDEIDYVVGTSEKGVMVKIKYEQKIKVEDEEKEHEHEEGEEHDHEHEEGEEPSPEEEGDEPPTGEETPEPPADEETPEPPADEETPEPPAEEEGAQLPETPPPSEVADDLPEEGAERQRALQAEQETKTQFEVIYDSIIEYTKGKNSTTGEAYDWENDVVLQTISLNTWNVISDIASDNETSSFSLTSPDGNITFTFTINQAPKGESASANKMKIDFELKNFPWTSDDSFVALLSTVETERKVDVKYRKGMESEAARMEAEDVFIAFDDVADTSSFTPFGEYSWAETAEATTKGTSTNQTADVSRNATTTATNETEIMSSRSVNTTSQTIKVVATSPLVERAERRAQEGKQVESIAYSFVGGDAAHRASIIYWDPSAGVDYVSSARPMLAMVGAGIAFAIFALF